MSGDQTPLLLLGPFSSDERSENVCTETEKRVRERRHVRNFMSLGSFGIVLEVALIKATERKKVRFRVFAAARRSPPQPAAARATIGAKRNKSCST